MDVKNYYWECPKCQSKVDVLNQLVRDCFDGETGEAEFSVEENGGLWFETIFCPKCKAKWILSTSGILNVNDSNSEDCKESCIAELITFFAKDKDDCETIRKIVDKHW